MIEELISTLKNKPLTIVTFVLGTLVGYALMKRGWGIAILLLEVVLVYAYFNVKGYEEEIEAIMIGLLVGASLSWFPR